VSRTLTPLVAILALGTLGSVAHAQRRHPSPERRSPEPTHASRRSDPSDAAERALGIARRELGEGPVTSELARLERLLDAAERRGHRDRGRTDPREVSEQYHRVQGALAAGRRRGSPALARSLADLEGELRDAGYLPAYAPPPPPPRPEPRPLPRSPSRPRPEPAFRFDGQFESLPVSFVAPSPDGIFQACKAQSGAFSSEWVDDIQVFGVSQHSGSGYWSVDALCSIAALNARPVRADLASVAGQVESVPFRIAGDRAEVERLLRRYLPVASQNEWIDEVTVSGQLHRNPSGWWNLDQVVQMVLSRVGGGAHTRR
jgi:hypothetical protein